MNLKVAERRDIPRIMEWIGQAKKFLKDGGVDQWQNGYPDQRSIEKDIDSETGYLCVNFSGEPAYDQLNGSWISRQPYVVAHRFVLDNSVKSRGLSSDVFLLVEDLSRKKNIHSFKVDTDNDNQIMKHCLQKNGFQYCGTICFDNSEKIAYEKLI